MITDVDKVIKFYGLEPRHLKLNNDETEELRGLVAEWVIQAQDLIISYTNNHSLKNDTPPAVTLICNRLVSNIINMAIARRDSPIIKVNDWKISTVSSEIFTEDIKQDLEPFKKEYSNKSDKITFFAITGED